MDHQTGDTQQTYRETMSLQVRLYPSRADHRSACLTPQAVFLGPGYEAEVSRSPGSLHTEIDFHVRERLEARLEELMVTAGH